MYLGVKNTTVSFYMFSNIGVDMDAKKWAEGIFLSFGPFFYPSVNLEDVQNL